MCVCVFVVCMYACMYVCVYACMHVHALYGTVLYCTVRTWECCLREGQCAGAGGRWDGWMDGGREGRKEAERERQRSSSEGEGGRRRRRCTVTNVA